MGWGEVQWGQLVNWVQSLEWMLCMVDPIKLSCISFELRGGLQKTMYAVALLVP